MARALFIGGLLKVLQHAEAALGEQAGWIATR